MGQRRLLVSGLHRRSRRAAARAGCRASRCIWSATAWVAMSPVSTRASTRRAWRRCRCWKDLDCHARNPPPPPIATKNGSRRSPIRPPSSPMPRSRKWKRGCARTIRASRPSARASSLRIGPSRRADGTVVLRSDPAHKMVNPVLYRLEEALACWQRISAPVLWVWGDGQWLHKWLRGDAVRSGAAPRCISQSHRAHHRRCRPHDASGPARRAGPGPRSIPRTRRLIPDITAMRRVHLRAHRRRIVATPENLLFLFASCGLYAAHGTPRWQAGHIELKVGARTPGSSRACS